MLYVDKVKRVSVQYVQLCLMLQISISPNNKHRGLNHTKSQNCDEDSLVTRLLTVW